MRSSTSVCRSTWRSVTTRAAVSGPSWTRATSFALQARRASQRHRAILLQQTKASSATRRKSDLWLTFATSARSSTCVIYEKISAHARGRRSQRPGQNGFGRSLHYGSLKRHMICDLRVLSHRCASDFIPSRKTARRRRGIALLRRTCTTSRTWSLYSR